MAERIEIIVTTDADTAAGTLDALADQVEDLTGLRPEITVQADTDTATEGLDTVADTAGDVDGTAVAVDVSAPGAEEAAEGLDAVAELAGDVDGTAVAVDVSAPGATDAVADIDAVTDAATAAADAADDIGGAAEGSADGVKGAAKDMLRPLGLAKSEVGDLTDAFQYLADSALADMDLSKEAVGKLAKALPAIGVAIGLAVSMWQNYRKEQEKAAEEADKLADAYRGVGDALAAGDPTAAAEALTAANEDLFESAADLGVPYRELTDYITGAADSIPSLEGRTADLGSATADLAIGAVGARDAFQTAAEHAGDLGTKAGASEGAIRTYTEGIGGAADAASDLAGYLKEINTALDLQAGALDVSGAIDTLETSLAEAAAAAVEFGAGSEEASDANRTLAGDLIDAKQDVIDYAEEVGDIPPATLTRILALLDQGKVKEAEAAFEKVSRPRTAPIKGDADTGAADTELDHAARDRTAEIRAVVRAGKYGALLGGWGYGGGGGKAAAPSGQAAGPTTMAAGGLAAAPAPVVHVTVDARGSIDPYSVGLAVERAAGAWGRVSGQWRPGQRAAG